MTTSGMIVVICCSVTGAWDLYAAKRYGVNYTVSRYIQQAGVNHPTLMIAVGVIIGHVFCAMVPAPAAQ